MDHLEAWRVQGRIATAIKNVRETAARLATDSEELNDAVAEAQRLGLYDDETPVAAGVGATL